MWLGSKRMEKLGKARLSLVSKPRHINSIFTVNTPILYIYLPCRIFTTKYDIHLACCRFSLLNTIFI